jgi:DNA-binding NarL/FixJ family response regulator
VSGPPTPGTVRVVLVDDQDLVRTGFRMILSVEDDIELVGEASDGREAVDLVDRLSPDVVLMDVQMPEMDGIEATRLITGAGAARVVILTTFERDDYLFGALLAGAVRTVAAGEALLAPQMTRRLIERFTTADEVHLGTDPRLAELTDRERDVLALVAEGLSNAEIAERLVVGTSTVKTHVSRILTKLDLRDRVQAVVLAYQGGLVRPPRG